MDIDFDFNNDWREFLIEAIKAQGYPVDETQDTIKLGILYYQLILRKISIKPRQLYKSDVFSCPTEHLAGLANLEDRITNGSDLKPNCSRLLDDLDYKDKMLFDWNIHHFHLGDNIDSDGYVTRTGPLAYAYVTEEAIYLIQILLHGGWTNSDLLTIIDNNWPFLLEPYHAIGAIDLEYEVNSIEHQSLRNNNLNTFIKINGKVLIGPGMGYAFDGSSIRAVTSNNIALRYIRNIEDHFKVKIEEFKRLIEYDETKGNLFHLYFRENGVYVVCEGHNIAVPIAEIFY